MKNNSRNQKILYLVELSMLIALIIVLQSVGSLLPLTAITISFFSLVPIVVGAIHLGPKGGAILGFSFGVVTIVTTPANAILMYLFQANPIAYCIVALLKATLAGLCGGLLYVAFNKLFKSRFKYVSTVLASASVPIVNTGVFILGMFAFFFSTVEALPSEFPVFASFIGANATQIVILGLVGVNFFGELLVNLVLSPAITRVVNIISKKIKN